jgi:hypothetical protein
MKTQILIILLLAGIQLSEAQEMMATRATMGRYGEKCMGGRGLCSFSSSANETTAVSKTTGRLKGNALVLTFLRAGLTEADEINIAGKKFKDFAAGEPMYFQQFDNLKLDPEALKELRIGNVYNNIAPGSYPIVLTAESVEVNFILTATKK